MSLQQELLRLEEGFWTGGPDAYRDHADETCLVAFAEMAALMGRDEIAATAEAGRWSDLGMTLKGLSQPTDEVVILTYEAHARRKDGEARHVIASSAYVRRADGWKLAFHQQTALPA